MKIVFFLGHDGFIRNFEAPLQLFAQRGHDVVVAVSGRRPALMSEARSIEDLCERYDHITHVRVPKGRHEFSAFADALYGARDYLRFLGPAYSDAPKLRARAREYAPRWAQRLENIPAARSRRLVAAIDRVLRALAQALPVSEEIDTFLREHNPDVVLVSPLINFRSSQNALVNGAKALGIPTALLVHSWDNLTNKGLIHHVPDRVLVWNEAQKKEAVDLHGVPAYRVIVTGAQCFDHWFDRAPRDSRDAFCSRVGLDPDRPYVLYVCSSAFIAPDEAGFVWRWIARLRSSGVPELERVGVLVRPHPQVMDQWRTTAGEAGENVSIWPDPDGVFAGEVSRSDYFESLYNAAAVVGVNTSAFVEAAIIGRPTLSVLVPEYRDTQEGTLHFRHLTEGPLTVARSFDDHLDHLHRVLRGEHPARGRTARFVERFVRPHGLDRPSARYVVDAIEWLARAPLRREPGPPVWHAAARVLLRPAALRMQQTRDEERRRRRVKQATA